MITATLARILSRNCSYTAMRVGYPQLFQLGLPEARMHQSLCQALTGSPEQQAAEHKAA